MSRPLPWFWIALAAVLLLLPMPVGRFLLDLLGGLTLTLLLLPLLAGAAVWIGWQILRSRLRPCPACGVSSFAVDRCPVCGSSMQANGFETAVDTRPAGEIDVSQVTINVEAVEVDATDSSRE
jgi:hypothetical protein